MAAERNGRAAESLFFWRAINVEVWLRVFFDRDGRTDPGGVTRRLAAATASPGSGREPSPMPSASR